MLNTLSPLRMQDENHFTIRNQYLSGDQKLLSTCLLAGFTGALLSSLWVCALFYSEQAGGKQLPGSLPVFGTAALVFAAAFLYIRNRKKNSAVLPDGFVTRGACLYTGMLCSIQLALSLLTKDTGSLILFVCWEVFAVISLPFFHTLKKSFYLCAGVILQAGHVILLSRLAGSYFWVWITPVLLLSGGLMLLACLLTRQYTQPVMVLPLPEPVKTGDAGTAQQVHLLNKNKAIHKLIHDFRNPLANIQLLTDYIQQYTTQTKDAQNELQLIIESCQQLNTLLDEALVNVKQEIAEAKMPPASVPL